MSTPPTQRRGYQVAGVNEENRLWWSGLLDESEHNPELQWPESVKVYDEMQADSQIESVVRAVTLPILRTDWRINPNGARDEVVEHVATDLGLPIVGADNRPARLRTRGRFSWTEHLQDALLMVPIGHSIFEQIYRLDENGRARLAKLLWLPHRTLQSFDVATDGGLRSVRQHPNTSARGTTGEPPPIPVDHLVAYVLNRRGGNWYGRSVLRSVHTPWWLKRRNLRTWSQTIERNGLGVPIYEGAEVPAGMTDPATIAAWVEEELVRGEELARSIRSGDTAGAAIPHGARLTFQGVTGTLPDIDKPVRYNDEQIARSVLAHFLNLGTQTGSWALGATFADFFVLSLQTVALSIANVAQQHIIEDLVDHNWGETEPAPLLTFDEIGSTSPATAEAIKALLDAEAISPDEVLEEHLRTRFRLPPVNAKTRRPLQRGSTTTSPPEPEQDRLAQEAS